ncbi:MAG: DNA-J related domain-containing protein [Pseudomonadota bacterium]
MSSLARADPGAVVNAELLGRVLAAVRAAPAGLTEHRLISELRDAGVEPFADARLQEPLSLFQTHFLLFHCLYRLRDALAVDGEWLRIHCLDIGVEAARAACATRSELVTGDPLRAYYLDLSRLEFMDAAAVQALLDRFWAGKGHDERRAEALEVLGLADPVDADAIRQRYRRLAQRHHPDRGGDTGTLQRINAARWVLLSNG